jgi:hypothetical protein
MVDANVVNSSVRLEYISVRSRSILVAAVDALYPYVFDLQIGPLCSVDIDAISGIPRVRWVWIFDQDTLYMDYPAIRVGPADVDAMAVLLVTGTRGCQVNLTANENDVMAPIERNTPYLSISRILSSPRKKDLIICAAIEIEVLMTGIPRCYMDG